MGSPLAGLKAGVISGVVFVGALALVNVILLYAFQSQALTIISKSFSAVCTLVESNSTSSAVNVTSPAVKACFSDVVSVWPEFFAFINFFIALFLASVFGWLYESLPSSRPTIKGLSISVVALVVYIYFGLLGLTFVIQAAELLYAFALADTVLFGYLLGKLYGRYSRTVDIVSQDGSAKILVDGKDFTNKKRTFSVKSVHEVKAEPQEGSSFKEWTVSGGVSVEDNRSYETTMEVNGDGVLRVGTKR
ncbi:MAG TPA: hypothetical protein VEJ36_00180 [Nitrososphaerales archaeon]|nr:hypothetical protein [Nitrososphaerales archaeon]